MLPIFRPESGPAESHLRNAAPPPPLAPAVALALALAAAPAARGECGGMAPVISPDGRTDAEKITMKLADVQDTLAKKAHDEWEALDKDD